MTGQNSLNNFYRSVEFSHPRLADEISDDVYAVAIHAMSADNSAGQEAANRLRRKSDELPELFRRVLASALTDLGYS